jgi:hypothetical protein
MDQLDNGLGAAIIAIVSADHRSDFHGQGPSADGSEPRGRGDTNTSSALPNCSESLAAQINRQGRGRVGNALRRHPLAICSIQTAQDKSGTTIPFALKDQAGAARQCRRTDFRSHRSTDALSVVPGA